MMENIMNPTTIYEAFAILTGLFILATGLQDFTVTKVCVVCISLVGGVLWPLSWLIVLIRFVAS